jgi:multidrug efflux pump subunit AcrA (membrane-fusion protein)
MSTAEQPLDPDLVEQTKQQIRALVAEIAEFARSEASEQDFFDAMLNRVVSAMAAIGGVVWKVGDDGRLELAYQIRLRDTGLIDNPDGQARHSLLIRKVIETGEGILAAPHSGSPEQEQPGNPTDFLLVLGPVKTDKEVAGVVEIFQRPTNVPRIQKGYLRFLMQICTLVGDYLKTRKLRLFVDKQVLYNRLDQFTLAASRSLDPREAAYTIANEGRRLVECDRVSVAIRKGRKCRVEAVSGQDTFDKRSNTVTLLSKLATAVANTGDPIWYTGDSTDLPPQVEKAVQDYVDESHTKTIAVLPLKRTGDGEDVERDLRRPDQVVGALIIEQIEDARLPEGMLQRVETVRTHGEVALANAIEHHNVFLLPVWKRIGKAKWLIQARTLPKTIAVTAAIVAAIVAMVVVPAEFQIRGDGRLVSEVTRDIWAPMSAEVRQIHVSDGQQVKAGELLITLESKEQLDKLTLIQGEIATGLEQLDSINSRLFSTDLTKKEQAELAGQQEQVRIQLNYAQERLRICEEQMAKLRINSPIAGEVISWDIEDQLRNRMVNLGERLLTVADVQGPLEIEVRVPENHMGHVLQAEKDRLARITKLKQGSRASASSELPDLEAGLKVDYILATNPKNRYEGRVIEIAPNAEVQGEKGNTVLVRVSVDREKLKGEALQYGTTATAKIDCGTKSIGYVWFHDLIAFVHRMWFRVPAPRWRS